MTDWKAIAKENGINDSAFSNRINSLGWSIERAATEPINKDLIRSDFDFLRIAEKNGISKRTFKIRVDRLGWPPDKAATTPLRIQKKRQDRHWIELAKQNGIAYDTYLNRVHNLFWDPEIAATTPIMDREEIYSRSFQARMDYKEIQDERINNDPNNLFKLTKKHHDVASENGICKATLHGRIYRYGWTVQEAITTPVLGSTKSEEFKHFRKIAESNGISYTTFTKRIDSGWSHHDAATRSPKTLKNFMDPWKKIALENGIKRKTYTARIRAGWPYEEAATTPPLPRGQFSREGKKRNLEAFKKFRSSGRLEG